jgi:hypothetical protein
VPTGEARSLWPEASATGQPGGFPAVRVPGVSLDAVNDAPEHPGADQIDEGFRDAVLNNRDQIISLLDAIEGPLAAIEGKLEPPA